MWPSIRPAAKGFVDPRSVPAILGKPPPQSPPPQAAPDETSAEPEWNTLAKENLGYWQGAIEAIGVTSSGEPVTFRLSHGQIYIQIGRGVQQLVDPSLLRDLLGWGYGYMHEGRAPNDPAFNVNEILPTMPVASKPGQQWRSYGSTQYAFSANATGPRSIQLVYEASVVVDRGPLAASGLQITLRITLNGGETFTHPSGSAPELESLTPYGILTPPFSPPHGSDDPKIDPGPENLPPWLARVVNAP